MILSCASSGVGANLTDIRFEELHTETVVVLVSTNLPMLVSDR